MHPAFLQVQLGHLHLTQLLLVGKNADPDCGYTSPLGHCPNSLGDSLKYHMFETSKMHYAGELQDV